MPGLFLLDPFQPLQRRLVFPIQSKYALIGSTRFLHLVCLFIGLGEAQVYFWIVWCQKCCLLEGGDRAVELAQVKIEYA